MLYVLPIYNMVNSTSLMEKIHWEYRFPDAFATVYTDLQLNVFVKN